jgi:hypothetical protein
MSSSRVQNSSTRPQMVDSLDLNELDDGMVVFAGTSDTVHHLNHTAAIVLQLCDGTRDADQIAAALQNLFHLVQPPLAETVECLKALTVQGLITED